MKFSQLAKNANKAPVWEGLNLSSFTKKKKKKILLCIFSFNTMISSCFTAWMKTYCRNTLWELGFYSVVLLLDIFFQTSVYSFICMQTTLCRCLSGVWGIQSQGVPKIWFFLHNWTIISHTKMFGHQRDAFFHVKKGLHSLCNYLCFLVLQINNGTRYQRVKHRVRILVSFSIALTVGRFLY